MASAPTLTPPGDIEHCHFLRVVHEGWAVLPFALVPPEVRSGHPPERRTTRRATCRFLQITTHGMRARVGVDVRNCANRPLRLRELSRNDRRS